MSMLQDILAMREKLRALPPIAIAFYFVDRDALYSKFTEIAKTIDPPSKHPLGIPPLFPTMTGVKVFRLRGNENDDKLPVFCKEPGVWVEFNNGTHEKVME